MPNWGDVMWAMYDHIFYGVPRKETLRRMIAAGLSARDAITEMREHEYRAEHGV